MKRIETEAKRAERLRDFAEAAVEYRDREEAVIARMARLKALRLAQADQHPLSPSKQRRGNEKPGGRQRAPSASRRSAGSRLRSA